MFRLSALVLPVPVLALFGVLASTPFDRVAPATDPLTAATTLPALDPINQACVDCHTNVTPGAVTDWTQSRHAAEEITCSDCHGEEHTSATDVLDVELPTPETCEMCHDDRVKQYKASKHARAWEAMKAMPTFHWQPMNLTEGLKGCGGCHKIGLKTDEEYVDLKLEGHGYGVASCDACHTRHLFSAAEARQPEACKTCHMGFDHPQWEMYSTSKHGVRNELRRAGVISAEAVGPTCQTCHMPDGDHEVNTAWGFLAVRLPMPDDPQWAADRTTILKALGVLSPDGQPTPRLDQIVSLDMVRTNHADWQDQRDRMIAVCTACHAENYARGELEKGDDQIRQVDRLMAQAIDIVAGLYADGTIERPASYENAYPDLLTFQDASTPVEQRLFRMFLEHRMRAFQGMFHMNPDYAFWYGWSEMVQDLAEIRHEAEVLRKLRH